MLVLRPRLLFGIRSLAGLVRDLCTTQVIPALIWPGAGGGRRLCRAARAAPGHLLASRARGSGRGRGTAKGTGRGGSCGGGAGSCGASSCGASSCGEFWQYTCVDAGLALRRAGGRLWLFAHRVDQRSWSFATVHTSVPPENQTDR